MFIMLTFVKQVSFFESVIYTASFNKLKEIVLGNTGCYVSSTVHGKVGTPWQCKIKPANRY